MRKNKGASRLAGLVAGCACAVLAPSATHDEGNGSPAAAAGLLLLAVDAATGARLAAAAASDTLSVTLAPP